MTEGLENDKPFIFKLNDNGCGPSLLAKVCVERGWRMYHGYGGPEEKWNLWWRNSTFPVGYHKTLSDWQFVNHIPKGGSICRKDNLSRLLRCMRKIYGAIYDFSPPGYHLPLEYAKLVSECSRLRRNTEDGIANSTVWIHKPVAQSQGRGIFLFRSVCEMRCGSAAVVQRYIERPLLIAGYKFDLRLYVCVPAYRPLTAYMYAEGLARFGTDKYTLSDIHNPYRHLTNSSLNKSGPRYAECKDRIGSGCKWTLRQVRRALIGRWGVGEWVVWQRIRALVALTLLAQAAGTPAARNCFEFYGFDVLLDDSLKPWLLEVNLSPALAADCEADIIVKRPMLHELFDLLGLPMRHTGLALLAAPNVANHNSSSDEENVAAKSANAERVPCGPNTRRGSRWLRTRRALPLHCVTLQVPAGKCTDSGDGAKDLGNTSNRTIKVLQDLNEDCVTDSSTTMSDQSTPATVESLNVESVWRTDAAVSNKRRAPVTCSWGNGVRWDRAPGRVGHWVRIYPYNLSQDNQWGVEDVREGVAQVSKFARAAREVAREAARDIRASHDSNRDAVLEASLKEKLCLDQHFEVWLPSL